MRYEVGDTVTILPKVLLVEYFDWIKLTEKRYTANVVPGMYEYAEKVAMITRVTSRGSRGLSDLYHINLDEGYYVWEDIMFERTEPLFDSDPVPTWVSFSENISEDIDSLLAAGERSKL